MQAQKKNLFNNKNLGNRDNLKRVGTTTIQALTDIEVKVPVSEALVSGHDNAKKKKIEEPGKAVKSEFKNKPQGRNRLFVGNLSNDLTDAEFQNLFKKYGISETFLNASRGFAFIRLSTPETAKEAKDVLDGSLLKGKPLRIRFAAHPATLKVTHIPKFVTNELLHEAFGRFGEVENAVVAVNDRGMSLGEGVVEFSSRKFASAAIKAVSEGVFLLTKELKPICVESLEDKDTVEGLSEKSMQVGSPEFIDARSEKPRFVQPGTFEFDMAQRWKQFFVVEKQKREQLERELDEAKMQLDIDMEGAMQDLKANALRKELAARQEELQRLEENRYKSQMERQMDYERRRNQSRPPNYGHQHQVYEGRHFNRGPSFGNDQMMKKPLPMAMPEQMFGGGDIDHRQDPGANWPHAQEFGNTSQDTKMPISEHELRRIQMEANRVGIPLSSNDRNFHGNNNEQRRYYNRSPPNGRFNSDQRQQKPNFNSAQHNRYADDRQKKPKNSPK